MRYYKLIRGYSAEDYIEIDETELEKAYGAFLMKKDGVYSGGAVRGSDIIAIQPDYHQAMGWNRGYKLGADDYAEISSRGIDRKHLNYLGEVKNRVQYLISQNKTDLIGKNIELPQQNKQISEEVKKLSDKFRV